MGVVPMDRFNLNSFYEKTPTALKYILIISLIVVGSYFLFSKKVSKSQDKELAKIEQTIETTYNLLDRFDDFETAQYQYNKETMSYLKNIYTLVEELNENTNKKFDLLIAQGGLNTYQILSQLTLLNQSYEKLTEAYTPEPFEKLNIEDPRKYKTGEVEFYPVDEFGNRIDTTDFKPEIKVKKKNYDDDQYEY
jgi:hypothetical protein